MNARCIALIAGTRERWPLAGDNLFIDMDLTPGNLPPGTRLAIGAGKKFRLRGIYARVVKDGRISAGDRVVKLA